MRQLVQSTIRTMRKLHPPSQEDDAAAAPLSLTPEAKKRALQALVALGYREGHVQSALTYVQSRAARSDPLLDGLTTGSALQDILLQYLQITLSEEELPTSGHGYQPTSAETGIRVVKRVDKPSGLKEAWLAEKIAKEAGYPLEAAQEAVEAAAGDEATALDLLARRLAGWSDTAPDANGHASGGGANRSELARKRETEVEALEAMCGKQIRRASEGRITISIPESPQPLLLHVILFSTSHAYPSPSEPGEALHLPVFYLSSGGNPAIPAYIRLHLLSLLVNKIRDLEQPDWREILEAGEGGLIYEMVAYLGERVVKVLKDPPPASEVLRNLRHDEEEEYAGRTASSGRNTPQGNRNRNAPRRAMVPGNNAALAQEYARLAASPEYQAMLVTRHRLPAYKSRTELIRTIELNRVVIVSGATGSGKTTQVPSYILEELLSTSRGATANIICTQPRRISAIGVAARVADEWGKQKVGDGLIGYAIRGERKAGRGCRLLFCTTGILLQRRSRGGDPNLDGVSHVFVDEVHERSLDSDFLLLILREVLERNPSIKIILMSATADSDRFSRYFGGAPLIEIPGQTHPVEDFYLEDVIRATQYIAPSMRASRKYSEEEDEEIKHSFIAQGITNPQTVSTLRMLAKGEKLDYDLVAAAVLHIVSISDPGEAILIFVTGVAEITQTMRAVEKALPAKSAEVLPLHANLSSADQSKIFKRTSRRKIIVATNVAETSITVDDVVFVIDTGRVKETRFDPANGLQLLVEDWNSLAGARQRRGRAGRVKPGQCWKLFTRWQEARLPSHAQPEILRSPLPSLVLQVKALRGEEDVAAFLGKALDPPHVLAIAEALNTLTRLGALQDGDPKTAKLTPLGQNLTLLPLDLRLGKMLVLASIFDCLDPVLTLCAALSTKSIFNSPPEKRQEASSARLGFSTGKSDLLTDMHAIETALAMRDQPKQMREFCEDNFISQPGLREIMSLRVDYINALRQAGFEVSVDAVPASLEASKSKRGAVSASLLKAIIYAGTCKAVRVRLPETKYESTIGGTTQIDHEAKQVRFFDTDGRVFIHPSSILFSESKLKNGYITYFNKSVTSKPFLRDATELPLYALLIFGQGLCADPLRGGLTLDDGGIRLRAPPRSAVLVKEMRRLLDVELATLIDYPEYTKDGPSPVIRTMMTLLDRDGS